jgi:hypothetical protein
MNSSSTLEEGAGTGKNSICKYSLLTNLKVQLSLVGGHNHFFFLASQTARICNITLDLLSVIK